MGLTGHSGLRRRTAGTPSAVQNPFSPGSVPNTDLSSGRRNEESSSEGAILDAPFVSSVVKKGGTLQHPVINLANFNKFVIYAHFKMEDLKTVSDLHGISSVSSTWEMRISPSHYIPGLEIHPLPIQRENVSIHLSPIRVNIPLLHFYQSAQNQLQAC